MSKKLWHYCVGETSDKDYECIKAYFTGYILGDLDLETFRNDRYFFYGDNYCDTLVSFEAALKCVVLIRRKIFMPSVKYSVHIENHYGSVCFQAKTKKSLRGQFPEKLKQCQRLNPYIGSQFIDAPPYNGFDGIQDTLEIYKKYTPYEFNYEN